MTYVLWKREELFGSQGMFRKNVHLVFWHTVFLAKSYFTLGQDKERNTGNGFLFHFKFAICLVDVCLFFMFTYHCN